MGEHASHGSNPDLFCDECITSTAGRAKFAVYWRERDVECGIVADSHVVEAYADTADEAAAIVANHPCGAELAITDRPVPTDLGYRLPPQG